ncbi:hypothetical protein KNP414_07901 [Paenibacillus mucilaginosus KNP414]|uniref:Uncharacterized protein n=1 Tax=Paenibacillus mucilaginosus (strain KNP414) TaxID=1036673 RepID=F8FJ08_PAEMK|nr:hypothetical protein KNP414_07901 [Paenibacillus mucilaginosus KNP414]
MFLLRKAAAGGLHIRYPPAGGPIRQNIHYPTIVLGFCRNRTG